MRRAAAPEISVVIPVRNRAQTLVAAVASAHAQTSQPHQVIVVDDASDDSTPALVKSLEQAGLVTGILLNKGVGAAEARNIGWRAADADFIAFLDSDDIWLPTKLAEQLKASEGHDAVVVCGFSIVRGRSRAESHMPRLRTETTRRLLEGRHGTVVSSTLVVPYGLLGYGGFDGRLPALQDLDLAILGSCHYPVRVVRTSLVVKRVSDPATRVYSHAHAATARRMILEKYAHSLITSNASINRMRRLAARDAVFAGDLTSALRDLAGTPRAFGAGSRVNDLIRFLVGRSPAVGRVALSLTTGSEPMWMRLRRLQRRRWPFAAREVPADAGTRRL